MKQTVGTPGLRHEALQVFLPNCPQECKCLDEIGLPGSIGADQDVDVIEAELLDVGEAPESFDRDVV